MSVNERLEDGMNAAGFAEIAGIIAAEGVSCIALTDANYESMDGTLPARSGVMLEHGEPQAFRAAVGPDVAIFLANTYLPAQAAQAIESGNGDAVMLGRQLLADPTLILNVSVRCHLNKAKGRKSRAAREDADQPRPARRSGGVALPDGDRRSRRQELPGEAQTPTVPAGGRSRAVTGRAHSPYVPRQNRKEVHVERRTHSPAARGASRSRTGEQGAGRPLLRGSPARRDRRARRRGLHPTQPAGRPGTRRRPSFLHERPAGSDHGRHDHRDEPDRGWGLGRPPEHAQRRMLVDIFLIKNGYLQEHWDAFRPNPGYPRRPGF